MEELLRAASEYQSLADVKEKKSGLGLCLEKCSCVFSGARASDLKVEEVETILEVLSLVVVGGLGNLDGDTLLNCSTAIIEVCRKIRLLDEDRKRRLMHGLLKLVSSAARHTAGNLLDPVSIKQLLKVLRDMLKKDSLLESQQVNLLKESSLGILSHICHDNRLSLLDHHVSGVLQLLLQLLQSAFQDHKSCTEQDVQRLIRLIPVLLESPGPDASKQQARTPVRSSSSSASSSASRYVPPHLRGGGMRQPSDSDLSDSDYSDSGESLRSTLPKFEKTAYIALQVVEGIASLEPKYLQAYYPLFFPSSVGGIQSVNSNNNTAAATASSDGSINLLGILASERSPKIRLLAAKLVSKILEGPTQRKYLAIAEVQKDGMPQRGFTTLSISLGNILTSLHSTLMWVIEREGDGNVLAMTLRTLSAVIQGSPYSRLQQRQAVDLFDFLFKRFERRLMRSRELRTKDLDSEDVSILVNAVNCFALLVAKNEVASVLHSELKTCLSGDSLDIQEHNIGMAIKYVAIMAEVSCNSACPPRVRLDTSVCLHRFAKVLPVLVAPFGEMLLGAIEALLGDYMAVEAGENVKPSLREKICQQLIRVLAETLHLPDRESAPKSFVRVDFSNEKFVHLGEGDINLKGGLISFCEEVMTRSIVSCRSPVILSAVLQSLVHLKSNVAREMEFGKVQVLLTEVGKYACAEGNSIAIRSAACKALGSLLTLEPVYSNMEALDLGLSNLTSLGASSSGTLQISLAWSLANVCDVFRLQMQSDNLEASMVKCVAKHLSSIAQLCTSLASCNDKIRCNAVRCLGYIFDISAKFDTGTEAFTEKAVACILHSLQNGNTKVQWNCCYAVGSFFKKVLRTEGDLSYSGLLEELLEVLDQLLKRNNNLKVLSHAVSSLAILERIEDAKLKEVARTLKERGEAYLNK
jgi:hypothetical protein